MAQSLTMGGMNTPQRSQVHTPEPRRLFLVEDDPVHVRMAQMALKQLEAGWEIVHCICGADALAQIEQPRFDFGLAIIDMGLPDIAGLDVVRALRRRFPDVPVLVISFISAERTLLEAIRAGANGYLLKDGNPAGMAQGMRQALEGQSPISPALARHLFKLAGQPQSSGDPDIRLTDKEREVLQHIGRGNSYAQTASLMGVGLSTVQTHIRHLYRKLGAHSQTQAVLKARQSGLI